MKIVAIIFGFVNIIFSSAFISEILDYSQYSFLINWQFQLFILVFIFSLFIYYLIFRFFFKKDFRSILKGFGIIAISSFATLALIWVVLYFIFRNFLSF